MRPSPKPASWLPTAIQDQHGGAGMPGRVGCNQAAEATANDQAVDDAVEKAARKPGGAACL